MVKDRFEELRKMAMGDFKSKNKSDNDDMSEDSVIVVIKSPDKNELFFSNVEKIRTSLGQMESLLNEMRNYHYKMLSATKPDDKLKKYIEDININFKMLSKQTKENIALIEAECSRFKDQNCCAYRMRNIQLQVLRKRLLDVISNYHLAQVDYRTKSKELLKRQIEITNQQINDEELNDILDKPTSEIFIQGFLTETREAKEQLAEIQARHADILKIEKNIRELNEMFQTMADLVTSQGEMIDRIENHVTQTHNYVDNAREQTKIANEYQKKARKCKIYIAIILIVLVLLIVWASI